MKVIIYFFVAVSVIFALLFLFTKKEKNLSYQWTNTGAYRTTYVVKVPDSPVYTMIAEFYFVKESTVDDVITYQVTMDEYKLLDGGEVIVDDAKDMLSQDEIIFKITTSGEIVEIVFPPYIPHEVSNRIKNMFYRAAMVLKTGDSWGSSFDTERGQVKAEYTRSGNTIEMMHTELPPIDNHDAPVVQFSLYTAKISDTFWLDSLSGKDHASLESTGEYYNYKTSITFTAIPYKSR